MKLKRHRSNAKTAAASRKYLERGTQFVLCRKCQAVEIEVGSDVSSVICSDCVQRMIPGPEIKVVKHVDNNGEKFPRGWHLRKRYVASDGTVYERGKKVGAGDSTPTKPKSKVARVARKTVKHSANKRGSSVKRSKSTGPVRKRGRPRKNGSK